MRIWNNTFRNMSLQLHMPHMPSLMNWRLCTKGLLPRSRIHLPSTAVPENSKPQTSAVPVSSLVSSLLSSKHIATSSEPYRSTTSFPSVSPRLVFVKWTVSDHFASRGGRTDPAALWMKAQSCRPIRPSSINAKTSIEQAKSASR